MVMIIMYEEKYNDNIGRVYIDLLDKGILSGQRIKKMA